MFIRIEQFGSTEALRTKDSTEPPVTAIIIDARNIQDMDARYGMAPYLTFLRKLSCSLFPFSIPIVLLFCCC